MRTLLISIAIGLAGIHGAQAQYAGGPGHGFAGASRGTAHLSYSGAHTLSGTAGTRNDNGWRMLAAPVATATRADLSDDVNMTAASGSVVYTHNGADFTAVSSDAAPLPSGRGFLLYLYDDAVQTVGSAGLELDFPGDPPSADVGVTGLGQADQWHLLGNPFDVGLDLSAVDLVGQGFQAAVQVWDPRLASWRTITQDAGSSDVLASMQGFFAERATLGAGAAALTLPYAGRTFGGTLIGGKTSGLSATLPLSLRALDASGREIAADHAASLYFTHSALEGWDSWDATRLHLPMSEGDVVLVLPGPRGGAVVDQVQRSHPSDWMGPALFPLEIRAGVEAASFEISWPSLESLPSGWRVYLLDRDRDEPVDLRHTASYRMDSAPKAGALSLVILPSENDILPVLSHRLGSAFPNPFATEAELELHLAESEWVEVTLYDMLGRRLALLKQGTLPAGVHAVRIDGTALPAGAYLCVLKAGNRRETRVLIKGR